MKQQKVKIPFVCVENARQSEMAQGFAEIFGKEKLDVYSSSY
jgi:protein-tyrosine-phosphatase